MGGLSLDYGFINCPLKRRLENNIEDLLHNGEIIEYLGTYIVHHRRHPTQPDACKQDKGPNNDLRSKPQKLTGSTGWGEPAPTVPTIVGGWVYDLHQQSAQEARQKKLFKIHNTPFTRVANKGLYSFDDCRTPNLANARRGQETIYNQVADAKYEEPQKVMVPQMSYSRNIYVEGQLEDVVLDYKNKRSPSSSSSVS
ncbi:hypothetical protein Taro_010060 [Colocasia esculenta]|uniref:Uncharacterized protein n=1 Tax=Colocasia esculenta TaxID=4460 RepID=A0A843U8F9_COLES|nr:hypothetical protein [Colocasia esculenta]